MRITTRALHVGPCSSQQQQHLQPLAKPGRTNSQCAGMRRAPNISASSSLSNTEQSTLTPAKQALQQPANPIFGINASPAAPVALEDPDQSHRNPLLPMEPSASAMSPVQLRPADVCDETPSCKPNQGQEIAGVDNPSIESSPSEEGATRRRGQRVCACVGAAVRAASRVCVPAIAAHALWRRFRKTSQK